MDDFEKKLNRDYTYDILPASDFGFPLVTCDSVLKFGTELDDNKKYKQFVSKTFYVFNLKIFRNFKYL